MGSWSVFPSTDARTTFVARFSQYISRVESESFARPEHVANLPSIAWELHLRTGSLVSTWVTSVLWSPLHHRNAWRLNQEGSLWIVRRFCSHMLDPPLPVASQKIVT